MLYWLLGSRSQCSAPVKNTIDAFALHRPVIAVACGDDDQDSVVVAETYAAHVQQCLCREAYQAHC